jgi:two-component system chemotaxis response regulator CheB
VTTTPGGAASQPIRVLVVDDSTVIRRVVTDILRDDPAIEVVGTAHNGRVAVTKVEQLNPDVVTMDVEMPEMNGIEAVRAIRKTHPRLPIVMFSTITERGAAATLDALSAGASDYVTKPTNVRSIDDARSHVQDQLVAKVKALAGRRAVARQAAPLPSAPVTPVARPRATRASSRPLGFGVLAIGCSTGGPDALATVLSSLPADLKVPVVIVQHMPPLFTRMLAQRLDSTCHLQVSEAVDGDAVVPGRALMAPGGRHMTIEKTRDGNVVRLNDDPPENFCRPAVDVLFRSVAKVYADRSLALVLTGMGRDGASGAEMISRLGGEIVVQDEATSVVWGMPGAVAQAGVADRVVPLPQIGAELMGLLAFQGRAAATGARSAAGVG